MQRRLVALLGAAAIVLAACQPGTPTAPPGSSGAGSSPGASTGGGSSSLAKDQILDLYCCSDDPRSLQPQAASGADELSVIGATNRGLLYYNPDLSLRPELAEAMPEVSSDGLTYTFKLKQGLKYSNGDPIVAGDFVRAARILADPRNAFDYGYEACWLKGSDKALGSDFCSNTTEKTPTDDAAIDAALQNLGVEAPDDTTVVYHLAQPANFFPQLIAMWLFTPVNEKSKTFAEAADFISSGPFMISEWTHTAEITLVPNPNWSGQKPTLTEIHLHIGGDPEAALAAYEQGTYGTAVVPGTSIRRVADDPTLSKEIKDLPQLGVTYFDFQTCMAPNAGCPTNEATKDKKSPSSYRNFRIALTQAVNKQELIDQTYGGLGTVATSSVMPGIPGWPDDYDPYKFDVAAAKVTMGKAMDDMGIPSDPAALGLTGTPTPDDIYAARVHKIGRLKFGYNCNAGHEQRVFYLYDAWRNNLGFAGSQFDISCTDFGTFRTERRAGNVYDIQRNAWGADFPHPDNQLRDLFATGAGNNNNGYSNPQFDDLLNKAAAETDDTKANELYKQAQRLLVDDAAVLFLRWTVQRYVVKPYVSGLTATASDHVNIGDIFYETIQILEH